MSLLPQYKASKEGTVMGVAVSKISMLTHCQALTQACNYCEGPNPVLQILHTSSVLSCLMHLFFFCLASFRRDTSQCSGLQEGHGPVARRPRRKIKYTLKYTTVYFNLCVCVSPCGMLKIYCVFFLSECHEQDPHHHSPVCCHESVSHVLGAEGPHSQRFGHCS